MNLKIVTLKENPGLLDRIGELEDEAFARWLNEDPTWQEAFPKILETFPEYQLFFLDSDTDTLLAASNQVPFYWDEKVENLPRYQQMLLDCVTDQEKGIKPNSVCGIMAIVPEKYQGTGLGNEIFTAAMELVKEQGLKHAMCDLRPILKHLYPTVTLADYMTWKDSKGRPIDPWARTSGDLKAEYLGIAPNAIVTEASVAQWEEWTGLIFPQSGEYVIPEGHQLLKVDVENNVAIYAEDHLWFEYFE